MAGLTALQVKTAKTGRHADGRGLYLVVRESGSRAWVLRTQADGKRRDFGLGATDVVSLADARAAAADLRKKIKNGEQPEGRGSERSVKTPSFEVAARACHDAMRGGWRNKGHTDSWLASLENHAFEALGSKPVDAVDGVMVRDALWRRSGIRQCA